MSQEISQSSDQHFNSAVSAASSESSPSRDCGVVGLALFTLEDGNGKENRKEEATSFNYFSSDEVNCLRIELEPRPSMNDTEKINSAAVKLKGNVEADISFSTDTTTVLKTALLGGELTLQLIDAASKTTHPTTPTSQETSSVSKTQRDDFRPKKFTEAELDKRAQRKARQAQENADAAVSE
jgi:hypothetical protein